MTQVIVASPEPECPAGRALRAEGIPHTLHLTPIDTDYGALWWSLWQERRPFIVCEWDIVPWPGAIAALRDCPEPWCTHRYPLHLMPDGEGAQITTSFGINKIRPIGPVPNTWLRTPWQLLDGEVVPVLNERFGQSHVHEPPVAHVKAR